MKKRRALTIFYSGLLYIFMLGCGDSNPTFSVLPESNQFVQDSEGVSNKVDILFVINDEPSMSSFQDALVSSFGTFIQLFEEKGFDFKIAVVTTSGYMADPTLNGYDSADEDLADFNDTDGTVSSGYPVLTSSSPDLLSNFSINSHPDKNTAGQDGRAFSSFRQALQSMRPINQGFIREDAFLAVVIVDNQDDFSGNDRCVGCNNSGKYSAPTLDPVEDYADFLDNITNSFGASRKYNVSAMTQTGSPCQGGSNMTRIMELVNLTNGVLGDICDADFGPSMIGISDNIATLSTQFYLNRTPKVNTITVLIDGVLIANDSTNGWTYNSEANAIKFHGSAVPATGAVIDVDFETLTLEE